jgi:DNA-directed RNA polymerase specialized sigma24 family protein
MAEKRVPEFVKLIDSDPDKAFREFYKFLRKLVSVNLPKLYRLLSKEDQEEVLDNVAVKCWRDNWKVMRKCVKSGGSVAGYLRAMVQNAAFDRLFRDKWLEIVKLYEDITKETADFLEAIPDLKSNPEREEASARILGIVKDTILHMSENCQMLLLLASEEYEIRYMVQVLGLPKDRNKAISGALGECRKKLRKLLLQKGIEIDAILKEIKYS